MSSVLDKAKRKPRKVTTELAETAKDVVDKGQTKKVGGPKKVKPGKTSLKKSKGAGGASTATELLTVVKKTLPDGEKHRAALLSDGNPLSDVSEWIPTCFPAVDEVLGGGVEAGGGLAVGRISEVYGPEGAGKSALTHMCIKGVQSIGGTAVVFDFEAALDMKKIKQLGIDPERLLYLVPDSAEQGAKQLEKMVDTLKAKRPDAPVLFVWDSVAATPMIEERSKDIKGESYAGAKRAALFSTLSRELMLELAFARAHVLFVNQERENLQSVGFIKEPNVPGGKGIKYAASQRVRVQKVKTNKKTVKGKAVATSYITKLTTKKCRLTPPHQSVELILDFRRGLSPELSMLHQMTALKVATKTGGKYKFKFWKDAVSEEDFVRLMAGEGDDDGEFRYQAEQAFIPVVAAANWVNADTVSDDGDGSDDESGDSDDEEMDPDVS